MATPRPRAGRGGGGVSARTVVLAGLLPFLFGLASIAAFVRHYRAVGLPLRQARAASGGAAADAEPGGAQRAGCPPPGGGAAAACNCSEWRPGRAEAAGSADVLRLAGRVSKTSVGAVLDAANATDPAQQSVRVNEDTLEDVFLFVGILSGRGYRHRRLAVREAWANRCQVSGVSVCRFILSQDEMTPQVRRRLGSCALPGKACMHACRLMMGLAAGKWFRSWRRQSAMVQVQCVLLGTIWRRGPAQRKRLVRGYSGCTACLHCLHDLPALLAGLV